MDEAQGLAGLIAEGHRSGVLIDGLGALPAPPDVAAAMKVQAQVAEALGESVAGWKVGITPEGEGLAAPLFSRLLFDSPASRPLGRDGILGIEVEVALRLGRDLEQGREAPSPEALFGAAASVVAGIEIVASRFRDQPSLPFTAHLADNLANAGYVVGGGAPGGKLIDLAALHCRVEIGGELAFDAVQDHPQGDPLVPLAAWAAAPAHPLGGMRAGQIVTLGTLCGLLPVTAPGPVRATVEGIGSIALDFT
jgi:2-keto-4-pentenoate hydratase